MEYAADGTYRARARRVEPDGTPSGSILVLGDDWKLPYGYPTYPSLAAAAHQSITAVVVERGWVGSAYFSSTIYYVDASGKLVGSTPDLAASFFDLFEPAAISIAEDAAGWFMAWSRSYMVPKFHAPDELRVAHIGQHVAHLPMPSTLDTQECGLLRPAVTRFDARHAVLWGDHCDNPLSSVILYRVGSDSDATTLDTTSGVHMAEVALASAQGGGLAAWSTSGSNGQPAVWASDLDSDAQPIGGTRRALWIGKAKSLVAEHDGGGYLVAWVDAGEWSPDDDALSIWVDPDGDSPLFQLTSSQVVSALDVASSGDGRSAILLSVLDSSAATVRERLYVKFVERSNDACPSESVPPDGAAGEGSAGEAAPDESPALTPAGGCACTVARERHDAWPVLLVLVLAGFSRRRRGGQSGLALRAVSIARSSALGEKPTSI